MQELRDRVAVVTGAAGGIGRALSLAFARAGMHVVVSDVDTDGLVPVAREIERLGRRVLAVETDVRSVSAVESLLARTLDAFGACHLVANNAGVFHGAALLDTPEAQWERVLEVNLWGVIHGCRVFGRHFVGQRLGHIVNTASAAGLFPVPGMSAYSTSKFAVMGLSQQLRWELSSEGVGVTVLCPGVVRTEIHRAAGVGLDHLDLREIVAKAPTPERLAEKAVRAVQANRALVRFGKESYLLGIASMLPQRLLDPVGRVLGTKALRIVRGLDPL